MASRDEEVARLIQGPHTDAIQRIEDNAIRQAIGGLDDDFTSLSRDTTTMWTRLFGGPRADAGDDKLLQRILDSVRTAIARLFKGLGKRVGRALEGALSPAVALGVAQGSQVLSLLTGRRTRGVNARPSRAVRRAARALPGVVDEHHRGALALLKAKLVRRLGVTGALAAVGRARGVIGKIKAAITHTVNEAVNDGIAEQIRAAGAKKIWVAERDSCFIPSTRVLAPSVLVDAPAPTAGLMPLDELHGLSSDPTAGGVGPGGEASAPTAAALAVPLRDRFSQVKAVTGRYYVGDLVTIRTASGKELSGTPNHPIAARRGWVSLAELQVGDHVFSRRRGQGSVAGIHPNDDDVPPTIEEVSEAFPFVARVVPTAPEDFHGDGVGSDIHVVRTDGLLLADGGAALAEHVGEEVLDWGDVELESLTRLGLPELGGEAALTSAVGGSGGSDDTLPLGSVELVRPAEVASDREPASLEPAADGVHVDAVDYGDFLGRLARLVEADEVIEVRHGEFRGHVYNLETREGWYLSEDIVCHNCVTCAAYAGHVVDVTEDFPGGLSWDPNQRGRTAAIATPPRHPHCRCRLAAWEDEWAEPGVPSLPEVLRREAWRSIARGWSLPTESNAARVRAARELLRTGVRLPKSVLEFAADAVRAGRFEDRIFPATGPGTGQ